jgi:hypothetical protein
MPDGVMSGLIESSSPEEVAAPLADFEGAHRASLESVEDVHAGRREAYGHRAQPLIMGSFSHSLTFKNLFVMS